MVDPATIGAIWGLVNTIITTMTQGKELYDKLRDRLERDYQTPSLSAEYLMGPQFGEQRLRDHLKRLFRSDERLWIDASNYYQPYLPAAPTPPPTPPQAGYYKPRSHAGYHARPRPHPTRLACDYCKSPSQTKSYYPRSPATPPPRSAYFPPPDFESQYFPSPRPVSGVPFIPPPPLSPQYYSALPPPSPHQYYSSPMLPPPPQTPILKRRGTWSNIMYQPGSEIYPPSTIYV